MGEWRKQEKRESTRTEEAVLKLWRRERKRERIGKKWKRGKRVREREIIRKSEGESRTVGEETKQEEKRRETGRTEPRV